ncbi:hypothetical protein Taro_016266 [Colocasia esculenta]|uniref:Protein kinase domain-containing protein n=1 Tax=Colocasia esculenta TaxID=4460 RepID=A0A843UJU5_COLES|nr:hypothetical protein [Colocasia esculenta]
MNIGKEWGGLGILHGRGRMAASGIASSAASDCRGFLRCLGGRLSQPVALPGMPSPRRRGSRPPAQIRCFSGEKIVGRRGGSGVRSPCPDEELDLGPITMFTMSDFALCDHVSIGLAGKGDEVIFEAVVRNSNSPLHGSRVVLRQLTTSQAQRRGWRALEVLKKLARRHLLYHSYAMQVYGYVSPSSSDDNGSFTLVHGYQGSYSLKHWLRLSDWLPTLEATLALDEEWVRRVGDDTIGGPAVSRQLRITRIVMRDLLIGVNYLHSHGLAHTQLRLENVHICPVDRHVKVGILGNVVDFYDSSLNNTVDANADRRQLMIAFDMRCVGFMMAKMVLQELMDPSVFIKFKSFLTKGNNPSCLREFLLPLLCRSSPLGNAGIQNHKRFIFFMQMLDRNWGAGWNLLSLLLATKPSERISCLDALRHPFLCGPRWRVEPSVDIVRWGLGSTAVRITEEYIYGRHQRSRLAYFIELMEMLNPHSKPEDWLEFLPGRWRLLYSTGRHIGLTLRQAPWRVLIGDTHLTFTSVSDRTFSLNSDISFTVMPAKGWPHDKSGSSGKLHVRSSSLRLSSGSRLYLSEGPQEAGAPSSQQSVAREQLERKWKKISSSKKVPFSLPAARFAASDVDVEMSFDASLTNVGMAEGALREVRTQIPPEMFDLSKIVCGTYLDARLMVLRGVNGSALLFTRSCARV